MEKSAIASTNKKFPVLKDLSFCLEKTTMFITFVIVPTIIMGIKHHLIILSAFLDHSFFGSSVIVLITDVVMCSNNVEFS